MLRTTLILCLFGLPAAAQQMNHDAQMNHDSMIAGMSGTPVFQPGQGAFAAVEEIIIALEADPMTDWSKVDIAGLREHLRDMDLVFIDAEATAEDIEGGQRFIVTGEGRVKTAIQNMTVAHAGVMDGVNDWGFSATSTETGAIIDVTVPEADLAKLVALGFFGVMAQGMHHQDHHWMMASGSNPHH